MKRTQRKLEKLRWARLTDKAPKFAPQRRTAMQARGLAYEKKILRALQVFFGEHAKVIEKPWIEFQDRNGWGICQPDALIIPNNEAEHAIIIEIKLTHKAGAESKLREFYRPVVSRAIKGRQWKLVQVFRNLTNTVGELVEFEQLVGLGYEYIRVQFRG